MKWRAELAVLAAAGLLSACASTRPPGDGIVKIGKPYVVGGRTYVPRDDRSYDATGLASWYGGGHHGRTTANGEKFDMNAISAAHPTLPMPSYAEVTALDTGRKVIVRINDRGPFASGRIIDLSRAAARQLGTEKAGVVRVRVRRVYPDGKARDEGPARTVAARQLPSFIQIAAFADVDEADRLVAAVRDVAAAGVTPGDNLYRVRLGPFADEKAARSALAEVRRRGYHDAQITSARP
ncbi:septal ring lytic transglycosylase RlpA family protein [Sphingomonas sp. KC8]|uniref:septal ring lytic transglycosylase RlpA family protein n=1 Tax=Sphingomonas sp. KC8 TaxID=1030157 RepID=UPI000248B554|nr:septal ring lytic transglycosylase RlpA family protein [Sphingomonas sp. KC8]ARS26017.1 rare lipoprotein A [Sphingomonas sp. KC8]